MVIRTVGRRIREMREQSGMTQTQLASRVNVSRSSVQSWECGATYPSIDNCVILADVFHVSIDYLVASSPHKMVSLGSYNDGERRLVYELLMHFDEKEKLRRKWRLQV